MKRELSWFIVFLIVVAIGGHVYFKSTTTFEKTVMPVIDTIERRDQTAFFKALKIDVVDQEAADRYFQKTVDQPIEPLIERLKDGERVVYETDRPAAVAHEDGDAQFLLFPKTWLWLYDSVDVQAPIEVREEIEQASFVDKAKRHTVE